MKKALESYYTKKKKLSDYTEQFAAGESGIHVQFIRLYISTTAAD
jgi:hypothetical protein